MKETMTAILMYMQKHVSDEITIEDIAVHFGYSKYHFSREFKKFTGFSAADYLSSIKIEQAKQDFLKKSNVRSQIPVLTLAFLVLEHFLQCLPKKTGLSPREYKNQVESLYDLAKNYDDTTSTSYYAEKKFKKKIAINYL